MKFYLHTVGLGREKDRSDFDETEIEWNLHFFSLQKTYSGNWWWRLIRGVAGAGVGRVSRTTASPRVRWISASPSFPSAINPLPPPPIIFTHLRFSLVSEFFSEISVFLTPFDLINRRSCLAVEETVAVDPAAAAAAPAQGKFEISLSFSFFFFFENRISPPIRLHFRFRRSSVYCVYIALMRTVACN